MIISEQQNTKIIIFHSNTAFFHMSTCKTLLDSACKNVFLPGMRFLTGFICYLFSVDIRTSSIFKTKVCNTTLHSQSHQLLFKTIFRCYSSNITDTPKTYMNVGKIMSKSCNTAKYHDNEITRTTGFSSSSSTLGVGKWGAGVHVTHKIFFFTSQ